VERNAKTEWEIVPVKGTKNETLVNGKQLTSRQVLADGQVIAIGREAKGVIKIPLYVHFE
jgi:hypothetical protein